MSFHYMCHVNATHELTISISNTQETETHLLCNPCYQDFVKCQECKNNEITIATLKNNQKIYVCSNCNEKLKEQAEQEKIAQEYKAKLNKILAFVENERYFFTVEKAAKEDKLTLEQLKELKTLLVQVWESDTDDNHSIWNKTVYVCPFIDHYLNILDLKIQEKQKPKNYLRKIQAVDPNCCNGKCQKDLADEPVEESTLTCNSCKTKFTSGFTVHSNTYFCESCGKKNHANKEFKVWIEAIQKENQQNNSEVSEPTPTNQENITKPNPNSGNKPIESNQSETKDKKTDNNPTEPNKPVNKSPRPDNLKKWGSDFGQLKPEQRKGRIKTSNNWDQKRQKIQKPPVRCCPYCQKTFQWDKNLEFLPAFQKVEKECNAHKKICSLKNNPAKAQKLQQQKWEKLKAKNLNTWYTCKKCWGKIRFDLAITDYQKAKKQALADLAFHEKECHKEIKKIAVYRSPNEGGNEHADLSYASEINEEEMILERDGVGEVVMLEQQVQNKTNWGLIGGVGLMGLGIIGLGVCFWNKRKAKEKG